MAATGKRKDYYDPIEVASRDELQAMQLMRLKWTLSHAYKNVPHYRTVFQEAGVHPDDLQSFDDLSRFPFTLKTDLRDNYPFGMFATSMKDVSRIHASSGTTGTPTVGGYTRQDVDNWADLVARSIYASGGRPGDMVQVSYGYGMFTGGLGAHYGAEKLGCTVIPMSGGQTQRQIQLIRDFKPRIIMVTPSYMLNLLDEFERQGMDPRESSLEIGIFGAEPWTSGMRDSIEERAGIDALDIYGLTELMGPGVANECVETKDGPTIWEDHFYPEIIDPETGEVLPDGEEGELVITTLTREAAPVIRYRTRDLTRLEPPTARNMRRIGRLTGRTDDMLIIRGVNVFPSQLEELIVRQPGLSPHYYLELSRKGNMDHLHLVVEQNRELEKHGTKEQTTNLLSQAVKDYVGISIDITIADPGKVERSIGKAKRVHDNRPKDN